MKFTRIFIQSHKKLGLPLHKMLEFLFFNSDVTISLTKIKKPKNDTKRRHSSVSVSAYNAAAMALILLTRCQKSLWNFSKHWNVMSLGQQLTLYMYKCLSHVLRRERVSFYVHFNTLIISQLFKTVKQNVWPFLLNWLSTFVHIASCV
jgi:hypothetical protein